MGRLEQTENLSIGSEADTSSRIEAGLTVKEITLLEVVYFPGLALCTKSKKCLLNISTLVSAPIQILINSALKNNFFVFGILRFNQEAFIFTKIYKGYKFETLGFLWSARDFIY